MVVNWAMDIKPSVKILKRFKNFKKMCACEWGKVINTSQKKYNHKYLMIIHISIINIS